MSPARAGILVGLFALLLVVYFGLEWRAGRVAEREAAAKRLFDVEAEAVTGVRVERPGEPAVRLAKAGGRWRIVEPRELRADQAVVDRLVRSVTGATPERTLEGIDPAAEEYGLARPAVTVTLETSKGPRTLSLGGEAPVGYGIYARRGTEGPVAVLPSNLRFDAARSLFDLRDKRVVDAERDQVRRVEVRPARGAPVVLEREGDRWRLEGMPAGRQLDTFKVDHLVDAAVGLVMTGVAAEDRSGAKGRGLEAPARTVVLGLEGGGAKTIAIGAKDEKVGTAVAVEGDPAVYLVAAGSLSALEATAESLLAPPPGPTPSPSPSPAASPGPSP